MQLQGLTDAEVADRRKRFGSNSLPVDKSKRLPRQLLSVLREPMMGLLLAAALISTLLGDAIEASALLVSVTFVISISLFQVRRTDKALEALQVLSAPKAAVYRSGELLLLPSEQVVVDDLILLKEGDRVAADCVLLEKKTLLIDESILTGESITVEKSLGDAALAGTLVVRGHATAKVQSVGVTSQLGQIGSLLTGVEKRTLLQSEVDKIVKVVATIALITAFTVSAAYALTRGDWLVGSLAGVAAAMALLPEELPIVLTIFLGLGAWRMARSKVIVRNNPAIEMLGQITVLCVDKTGTITMNEMTLVSEDPEIIYYGGLASIPGSFDPVDKAFLRLFKEDDSLTLVREFPLTEENLVFCQVWRRSSGELIAALKGAPERVIEVCELAQEQRTKILGELDQSASAGLRILGIAKATVSESALTANNFESMDFQFVGLAVMKDPVREGVADAITELSSAGIRTILITGDYPQTAESIGKEIGLLSDGETVTGEDLEKLKPDQLSALVRTQNVFSRVKPQQKLMLVQELQRQGEIVAMTGDGVNDAPALKTANVGLAMGKRGSEVAREAADLVIADDSFLSITEGVRAGRRIFANLRKAASYIIAIHIPIFGMALVPIASPLWPLVLLPIQIAILEIVIDPSASLAYESEPASKSQMLAKPRPKNERLITAQVFKLAAVQGVILLLGSLASFLAALSYDFSDERVRSVTFGTILLGNLLLMLSNRSSTASIFELISGRPNKLALFIFFAGMVAMILIFSVDIIRQAFSLSALEPIDAVTILVCAIPAVLWFELYKIRNKLRKKQLSASH
jgi:Ca2+-transporting ATPase